jgi:antitoxin PrlF
MSACRAKISDNGRIVIPAAMRNAAGLPSKGEVILRLEDGKIQIETIDAAVARAQEIVRRYVPEGGPSIVDEFLAERREEAKRE